MAPQKLTEYERRRLENIRRNDEMLASLKIHSKVTELSASAKRQRAQTKSYKVSPEKKPKTETPVVIRRSLRTRGMPPDASTAGGLKDDFDETQTRKNAKSNPKIEVSARERGPITMREASSGESSCQKLAETIIGAFRRSQSCCGDGPLEGVGENESFDYPIRVSGSVDLESLRLEPENIARVVPGRIMAVKFFPSADMTMIAVGNKFGNVGFWDVGAKREDGYGIYLYRPHPGPVSGIAVQPFSMSKVYTSCYHGYLRLMDVEKEVFDLLYVSDHAIFSISQRPKDFKSLFFSEGHGVLKMWDERAGLSTSSWTLHEDRINSIDFIPHNNNIIATSSTDGNAYIWDLRNLDANKPNFLKKVSHNRAVHSAYFSSSGICLATTSTDDKIGLATGANFEDISMIHHHNQTGRWISSFKAIWGWDDSCLFIGNMKRGVDVISTVHRRNIWTLHSPEMSAIPCRFDAHPYRIGMLAGATSGGQVYIWTTC
ncbi:hypothetical protein NMG60_11013133 [Bertholletia excelsa]